jgi:hypothetical protein
VLAVARVPGRYRRLGQRGIAGRGELVRSAGKVAALNFALPVVVAYLILRVPAWKVVEIFQPDLGWWLKGVAAVLLVKGLVEVASVWSLAGQTDAGQAER